MTDLLHSFLTSARENTYASGKHPTPGLFKEYTFEQEALRYIDRYVDQRRIFHGQEVIFEGSLALWSCSYRGGVQEGADPSEVFSYLRSALKNQAMHVRLAAYYEETSNDWAYVCRGQGSFTEFSGREEIHCQGKLVYRLDYFGGGLI